MQQVCYTLASTHLLSARATEGAHEKKKGVRSYTCVFSMTYADAFVWYQQRHVEETDKT